MKAMSLACAVWMVGLLCGPGSAGAQPATSPSMPEVGTLPPTIPLFPLQGRRAVSEHVSAAPHLRTTVPRHGSRCPAG